MHPRAKRKLIIGAIVALLVVAAVALYFTVFREESKPEKGIASIEKTTISVNGVELAAEVLTPQGVAHPPLLVMPGSFRGSAATYHDVSLKFARAGYQVVAYGQRGFGGSTGKVDIAGPATQRDAREVITWALEHTSADPKRVAMLGFSYGAGISLLTAAHDPRVRAVAALSTWTNFADAFLDVGTPHTIPLRSLLGGSGNTDMYDATLQHLQRTLLDHPADLGSVLRAMSDVRSPDSYVKELNENDPAIMIANAFQDSYFQPSQLLSFFDRLKTPKRLELGPGDHGGQEGSSLQGVPNDVVDDVQAWFAHYLRGADNGIDTEDPIVVKDSRTGEFRIFKSWPVTDQEAVRAAGKPGVTDPTVAPTDAWISTIHRRSGQRRGRRPDPAGAIGLVQAADRQGGHLRVGRRVHLDRSGVARRPRPRGHAVAEDQSCRVEAGRDAVPLPVRRRAGRHRHVDRPAAVHCDRAEARRRAGRSPSRCNRCRGACRRAITSRSSSTPPTRASCR